MSFSDHILGISFAFSGVFIFSVDRPPTGFYQYPYPQINSDFSKIIKAQKRPNLQCHSPSYFFIFFLTIKYPRSSVNFKNQNAASLTAPVHLNLIIIISQPIE